jgi:MFS family permease
MADRLKLHAFWNAFATNVAAPFVSFNVTASGASDLLIGYVGAISTLASAVTQLIGGRIADASGRRVAIAGLFSVFAGLLWIVTAVFQTPAILALLFTAITLILGVYAAGWTAILGEGSEGKGKGAFLGGFARLTSSGALAGLVLTTAIAAFTTSYTPLYVASGALFLLSALILRGQKEQKVDRMVITNAGAALLKRYYIFTGIYGLFWGFAWPLFTITSVKVIHMSLFEYGISQIIALGATVAFQPLVGRLVDKDRRKWVYPLAYMFFSYAWEVYAINIFSGLTNSLLNIAFAAYLYDISPTGQRGRRSAEFNLVTGVSTMVGSLAAGFALGILNGPNSLWSSLAYLYVIATVGRAVGALLHLRLPYGREGGGLKQGFYR